MLLKVMAGIIFLFLALGAFANTGMVFVHGKADETYVDPAVALGYWTADMIRASTANYSVPYYVCHYNGNLWMWEAADQIADQIYDFIQTYGITDLIIDTHSFGGTVVRWIFSNPDWNPKYQPIINATRWVNTIAAPHAGSEAADLAGTLSGSWMTSWITSLLDQNDAATVNCETSSMQYYNQYWLYGTSGRPALPKNFYSVSGYGLWNDFDLNSIALATLSGIVGIPGEDDGVVAEYSAEAVGTLWFRTEANHHHNRRNDYRPIGDALAQDLNY